MTAGAAAFPPELISTPIVPPQTTERWSRRSFWMRVVQDVVRAGGARAGLAWIGILLVCAIFAPFIANTQPLLVKVSGRWSSPAAEALTPTDVTLIAMFVIVLLSLVIRMSGKVRFFVISLATVATFAITLVFVKPPLTIDWQHYRDLSRAGGIQSMVMAPLPFSANDYQRDVPDARLQPPSRSHLLGTETNGADVLSRMIYASRIALSIGLISTGISVVIGVALGGLMGYFAGTIDILGMRLIEIFEAIPTLFLLITFVAFFGRNLYIMMGIIGLTGWTDEARFIRAEFLRLRKQDFVQAAIATGLPLRSILFRHLLPNGISPILVTSSFGIASAILYESTLSFLGLGLIDQPSWGQMLNQALDVGGTFTWWIALFPGLAIFLTVFSYNLIGEATRDALDPRMLKRE